MVQEGALLGGYLLPEKDFKEIIKAIITSDNTTFLNKIDQIINNCRNNIKERNFRAFYKNIDKLTTTILKNPPISLMAITDLNAGENSSSMKFFYQEKEKNTILKSGIISETKALAKQIYSNELSSVLSIHLSNMINYINKGTLKDISGFFNSGKYKFSSAEKKSEMGVRGRHSHYNLRYIIYGNRETYLGQIADAYLNHLGNCHKILFSKELNEKDFNINKTVMEEEGDNFYQLLIDSTNTTGLLTGGDLILLNELNEVIANIQLKTKLTTTNKSTWNVSYSKLAQKLFELQKNIKNINNNNLDNFINNFYDLFATSGISDKIEETAQAQAIKFVSEDFSKQYNININLT